MTVRLGQRPHHFQSCIDILIRRAQGGGLVDFLGQVQGYSTELHLG